MPPFRKLFLVKLSQSLFSAALRRVPVNPITNSGNTVGVAGIVGFLERNGGTVDTTAFQLRKETQETEAALEEALASTTDQKTKNALEALVNQTYEASDVTLALFRRLRKVKNTFNAVFGLKSNTTVGNKNRKANTTTNSRNVKTSSTSFLSDPTSVGSSSNATCRDLLCGKGATCTTSTQGAQCLCDEGYWGDGRVCNLPASYAPNPLFPGKEEIRDLSMARLGGDRIALVYGMADDIASDSSGGSFSRSVIKKGYLLLGRVSGTTVKWSAPTVFSFSLDGKPQSSYQPVVAGHGKSLAIVYRNKVKDGDCYLAAGTIRPEIGSNFVKWAKPVQFCESGKQDRKMAVVALTPKDFVALYAKPSNSEPSNADGSGGAAYHFTIDTSKGAEVSNGQTFAFAPGSRIDDLKASVLTEGKNFLVEYSTSETADPDGNVFYREMNLQLGESDEDTLSFIPSVTSMEPDSQANIMARDIAPVSDSLVLTAYYSGTSQSTVLKTMKIGFQPISSSTASGTSSFIPSSTARSVTTQPRTLLAKKGVSSLVRATSSSETFRDPKTGKKTFSVVVLYYPEKETSGRAQLLASGCIVDAESGEIITGSCHETPLLEKASALSPNSMVQEAEVLGLGFGRFVLVFTDATGRPFVRMFGAFAGKVVA